MSADLSDALLRISLESISAAGPRYSPAIDPDAPNIEIEALSAAIEALGQSTKYRDSLTKLATAVEQTWKDTAPSVRGLLSKKKGAPDLLASSIRELAHAKPGNAAAPLKKMSRIAKSINATLDARLSNLWKVEAEAETERDSKSREAIATERNYILRFQRSLSSVLGFLSSRDVQLVQRNRMLIIGEWGTGKTHFLCDATKSRASRNLPTLFLLAHRLPTNTTPLEAICSAVGVSSAPPVFLRKLSKLGQLAQSRALIIVDGINEGDREAWRKGIAVLVKEISKFDNLGLVISCRAPFDQQILGSHARRSFTEMAHRGFQDIEFDAQREFFDFYQIPNPHVPLLAPEFSRPLFLKILCKTFAGLTVTAKSSRIRAIASGQKGMTKLFEDFIGEVGRSIENDFGLAHKTCWRILKGQKLTAPDRTVGIGVAMADQLRDHLSLSECHAIVAEITSSDLSVTRQIVHRMVTDGLLVEDVIYDGTWKNVIRLSYQRFSDHLICRHLLESSLDTRSKETIRRSFYRNRPLGKIFLSDKYSTTYQLPGIASAMMLEFPERVKRTVSAEERELVFFLPQRARLMRPFISTFLEGLLWRDHGAFSAQTDRLVETLLKQPRGIRFQTFECLVCLASRPGHPYSAEKLLRYILSLDLIERDLSWSEFLRTAERESAVHRSMDWVERQGQKSFARGAVHTLIQLCALFLTTTNRQLRDRATKTLVLLGEVGPQEIFGTTLSCLGTNDPYISERLLAASYGVLMRNWAFPDTALVREVRAFARKLYDEMFAKSASNATSHILMRDYAANIVHLARKIDPGCLGRGRPIKRLHPSFVRSGKFPVAADIDSEAVEEVDVAIGMDFENYTCGRMVKDRRNYDDSNVEYKGVMRQLKWRMLDLGYKPAFFEKIDHEIARFGQGRESRAGKVDRYGKKYSWISYFELCGIRKAQGLLRYDDVRISDCDIDPSFPVAPRGWAPDLKPFFIDRYNSAVDWMVKGATPSYEHALRLDVIDGQSGPWLLLDGFVQEAADGDPRSVFTFMRGAIVERSQVEALKQRAMDIEYPGNSAIPEAAADHYTFAGEIPWSRNFCCSSWTKSGLRRSLIQEAFSESKAIKKRRRFDSLTPIEQLGYLGSPALERLIRVVGYSEEPETASNTEDGVDAPKYVDHITYKRVPGIKLEVPLHRYAWESYHSTENQIGSIDYVAPAICDALELRNRGSSVDLYDSAGRIASVYRESGTLESGRRWHGLYIREDLLERYLALGDKELIWINWGEREFKHQYFQSIRDEAREAWQDHKHIHRRFIHARALRAF